MIDVRQAYLQKVVKEGVRQLGHAREAENSIHFSYEMVALTPATAKALGIDVSDEDSKKPYIEMSGRKGLGVKADDLIDALQSKAAESVREGSKREGLTDAEIEQLGRADRRRRAPLLHAQVRPQQSHRLRFQRSADVRRRLRPYLQYSTVRVENIFRKMAERGVDARLDDASLDALTLTEGLTDEMWELVRLSAELPSAIRRATDALELSIITHDLFELAQKFNSFYHKYPILNEKDPAERQRRAVCADVFRQTMARDAGIARDSGAGENVIRYAANGISRSSTNLPFDLELQLPNRRARISSTR